MHPLFRAGLAGSATGLRSSVSLAALAPPRLRRAAAAAVIGELVVDKLPWTPSRLSPGPLAGRAAFAAAAGGLIAGRRGALVAAGAAVVSARAGHDLRARLAQDAPPFAVAAAEDVVALGLARLAQ